MGIRKGITTLAVFGLVLSVNAQVFEHKGFKSLDGDLIYQFVVEDTISPVSGKGFLKDITSVRNVEVSEEAIYCEFNDYVVDYKKQGRKWGNTPPVFNNSKVNGKIKLEFKEGRYRITLYGLMEVNTNTMLANSAVSFYSSYCKGKDGSIRQGEAIIEILNIYSKAFEDSFTLKQLKSSKDW